METIIFILICYGACNNLIYGSLFEGFRGLLASYGTSGYSIYKLFTCFMCLGTWMGFVIAAILENFGYGNLTPMGAIKMPWLMIFMNGLVAAGGVWLLHTLQEALESISNK